MSSDTIFDTPRTLTMNGITFLESDLVALQLLFPEMDMLVSTKEAIRHSPVLQKAILSGAAVSKQIEAGGSATLNLTQAGRALLGKI